MNKKPFHPSGITREPPNVVSTTLPDLPTATEYEGGRIGWPSVFEYGITQDDGVEIVSPLPPTEKAIREPSRPSPIPQQIQPRTMRYRRIIHDLARFERLSAEGHLQDPRHRGVPYT